MDIRGVFWFVAGMLTASALLFVLWPSIRSGAALAVGRRRLWPALLAVAGMAVAVGLYLKLGRPDVISTGANTTPAHAMGAPAATASSMASSMDSAVAGLEAKLAQGGGSDADWELLAKSYEFLKRDAAAAMARRHQLAASGTAPGAATATGVADMPPVIEAPLSAGALQLVAKADEARRKRDYAAARDVYRKLIAMRQMNADTWADYADVSASLNHNSLLGEPEKFLQQALQLNPRHAKALWLQGSVDHEAKRYTQAVASWQLLATLIDPGSSDARLIAANLAEDQQLAGGSAAPAAPAPTMAGGVVVSGEIALADALRSKVTPGMTLFILAKSVDSPGPPVAVIRTITGSWPLKFQLDDSNAMLPERRLSTMGPVTIEARISRSGQALSQPGDLLGTTQQLDPKRGKAVRITIEKQVG